MKPYSKSDNPKPVKHRVQRPCRVSVGLFDDPTGDKTAGLHSRKLAKTIARNANRAPKKAARQEARKQLQTAT